MKLYHEIFDSVFRLKANYPNVMVIENPTSFRRIISDIEKATNGDKCPLVISKRNQEINYRKELFLVRNPISFDDSSRSLWTPIYKELGYVAKSEKMYDSTESTLKQIEKWAEELIIESDMPVFLGSEINLESILKSLGLQTLIRQSENAVEYLLDVALLIQR